MQVERRCALGWGVVAPQLGVRRREDGETLPEKEAMRQKTKTLFDRALPNALSLFSTGQIYQT